MKCVHAMPFGAELRADGSVRFRLFAPAAREDHLADMRWPQDTFTAFYG